MPPTTRSKRKRQEAELEEELLDCVRRGDLARLRELVEIERVSVNLTNTTDSWSPLLWAVIEQGYQIARFLLENGAHVDGGGDASTSNEGGADDTDTPLANAVYDGSVALAQLLLENGANIDIRCYPCGRTQGSYSLLGWAIDQADVDMVALLLRFDANTEETLCNDETCSALLFACLLINKDEMGDSEAIIQLLLDHDDGVDVSAFDPKDDDGVAVSPLCWACRNDSLEIAQLLVRNGARVVYEDDDDMYPDLPCPLVHAVEKGSLELVQYLLQNAQFTVPVNRDPIRLRGLLYHPLSPALEEALRLGKLEKAQMLIDRGHIDINDWPFLWQCAKYEDTGFQHPESARFLLQNCGADVNLTDHLSGETPLWAAAERGNVHLVKDLLKAGANVNIRDKNGGETPLGVAYRQGHKKVVYLLLRTSPHVWPRLTNFVGGRRTRKRKRKRGRK